MNGRTSSVFARTPGNMFAGEQEGNGFSVNRDLPRRILIGESSFHARGGSDDGKEGKGLDCDGFPEDVGFGWKEKNALVERIEELEKELYDYQYHMGLLLIERKMQASKFEELWKGLSEARANLELERAALPSTLSGKQKQEQSIRSILITLEAEKQHVAELGKTIYKMKTEEKRLTEQAETLESLEPSLLEHELELKGSQDFLSERKMNITNEKEEFSKIQEKFEAIQHNFSRMNDASNYMEAGISHRQQNLASKEKEAESKQEKLEKKGRDLLDNRKLPTRESALQSEKQAFDQELESGRESLDGKLKDKLNKSLKQNAVEGEYGSQMENDFLAHEKEVETDQLRVYTDKETLNNFSNKLQNFIQEPMKKRNFLLSLNEDCEDCKNCNFIISEIDLATPENFEGDILPSPNEHLEQRPMESENDDCYPQNKRYQSIKVGGCRPCLQCSEIAKDVLQIECQPTVSSINVQNDTQPLSSKDQKGRSMPNKRTGSLKLAVENCKETLNDIPKEIKQLQKCCSEDLKDTNEESKSNLLNSAKMGGSAEQRDLLCDASETTSEFDAYHTKTQLANEGHRKRQRTGDIRLNFPGQKRYNFRPSTILKVLVSKLQSEHVFGRENHEKDIDHEPSNAD
ncbi:protein CROWDED NUCLEI 1-like [Phalaenopsis equestris]|uniref:protein CROWDED NUCLEI 1-like n=1 Tax=Phalaenopsis equestris TaxID=78828 RepID=UPI0009E1F4A6|nr:protein CROWDED NUCLEI 1-like [Phalaenopsis equestris]